MAADNAVRPIFGADGVASKGNRSCTVSAFSIAAKMDAES
jgi:hypothetical protein